MKERKWNYLKIQRFIKNDFTTFITVIDLIFLIFFVLILSFVSSGCSLQHTKLSNLSCSSQLHSSIDGWIDKIEDQCVVIWNVRKQHLFYVHRSLFPHDIREGDCIKNGQIYRNARKKMLSQIIQLQRSFKSNLENPL